METSNTIAKSEWSPSSWRAYPIKQQPEYKDAAELEKSLQKLRQLPPLTHPNEIQQLKTDLAAVCRGEKFLLQVRIKVAIFDLLFHSGVFPFDILW